MSELIYKDESYEIVGACFEVYKNKGCGFVEPVYQECLEMEFDFRKIPFKRQQCLNIYYRERKLEQFYKPDFICFEKIIVEIKAIQRLCDENRAQTMNYLKATSFELGLLVTSDIIRNSNTKESLGQKAEEFRNREKRETHEKKKKLEMFRNLK